MGGGGRASAYMCGVALAHVRARAWRTGIRVPPFLFPPFDPLWRFSRVSLFTGLSFSLSKRRLTRERLYDDVERERRVLQDIFT